jgi:predicted TIM-barrel fold metal-dependent hydrolase
VIGAVPPSAIEYATDTTRTVASLIFEKPRSAFKFPDIRWIWSHSGGTIPFLTSRFVRLAWERKMKENVVNDVLRKHYYEVAQGNTPGQLAALMKLVSISQVMFGSDYPFREAKEAVDGVAAYKFSAADERAVGSGNALKMFPNIQL